jgi:tape measure domain-containing protein
MPEFKVSTKFTAKDKLSPVFDKMGKKADKFGDKATRGFKRAEKSALSFKSVMGGILAADALKKAGSGIVSLAKGMITATTQMEDAIAGFQPLMGGVEQATKLVEELNKTAATTPFQFEGIASITKQLLPVMNGNIEDTIKTFRMLGDTAGGNIQKLESITRGYVKALLKGKPDMEALNMIAEAGVPIFSEMSKSMGITNEQLFELSKKGKLTNKDLTKAFERMTKEGGIFFGGMEIASKTLTGRWSTMMDNIKLAAGTIGTQLLPVMKGVVDKGIEVAQMFSKWATANKEIIKAGLDIFMDRVRSVLKVVVPIAKTMAQTIGDMIMKIIKIGQETGTFDKFREVAMKLVPIFKTLGGLIGDVWNLLSDAGVFTLLFKSLNLTLDLINKIIDAIQFLANIARPIVQTIGGAFRAGEQQAAGTQLQAPNLSQVSFQAAAPQVNVENNITGIPNAQVQTKTRAAKKTNKTALGPNLTTVSFGAG